MTLDEDDPRSDLDNRDVRPIVRLPSSGLSGAAITAICCALGLGLFLLLDGNRRNNEEATARDEPARATIASPQPLALPIVLTPVSEPVMQPVENVPSVTLAQSATMPKLTPIPPTPAYMPPALHQQQATPQQATQSARGDESASPLIIDLASADGLGNASATAGDDQAVRASVIRNRANLVPQGAMINAVLETPIDSRRPGLVRAVVSRDARGFDGTRLLIPRGSRLIGEAGGDAKAGQKRVLVTWTRLIRPDGVAIRIGSPAADVLGGAGIRGRVNTHFIERFGNAVLQSALTIGVNVASRPQGNSVIVGLPGQIGATGQSLLPNVDPAPTIKVASGAEISVFVARDLDFSGTGSRR